MRDPKQSLVVRFLKVELSDLHIDGVKIVPALLRDVEIAEEDGDWKKRIQKARAFSARREKPGEA